MNLGEVQVTGRWQFAEDKSSFLHIKNCLANVKHLYPNESTIQGMERLYLIYPCFIERVIICSLN